MMFFSFRKIELSPSLLISMGLNVGLKLQGKWLTTMDSRVNLENNVGRGRIENYLGGTII